MKGFLVFLVLLPFAGVLAQQQAEEDFRTFCPKFFADSTFQRERVKFPVLVIGFNGPHEPIDTVLFGRDRWPYSDFGYTENSYNIQTYDNFERQFRSSDERVLSFESSLIESERSLADNSTYAFFFKRIDGKWYLVKWQYHGD